MYFLNGVRGGEVEERTGGGNLELDLGLNPNPLLIGYVPLE